MRVPALVCSVTLGTNSRWRRTCKFMLRGLRTFPLDMPELLALVALDFPRRFGCLLPSKLGAIPLQMTYFLAFETNHWLACSSCWCQQLLSRIQARAKRSGLFRYSCHGHLSGSGSDTQTELVSISRWQANQKLLKKQGVLFVGSFLVPAASHQPSQVGQVSVHGLVSTLPASHKLPVRFSGLMEKALSNTALTLSSSSWSPVSIWLHTEKASPVRYSGICSIRAFLSAHFLIFPITWNFARNSSKSPYRPLNGRTPPVPSIAALQGVS